MPAYRLRCISGYLQPKSAQDFQRTGRTIEGGSYRVDTSTLLRSETVKIGTGKRDKTQRCVASISGDAMSWQVNTPSLAPVFCRSERDESAAAQINALRFIPARLRRRLQSTPEALPFPATVAHKPFPAIDSTPESAPIIPRCAAPP
jgi:hypothetical protein